MPTIIVAKGTYCHRYTLQTMDGLVLDNKEEMKKKISLKKFKIYGIRFATCFGCQVNFHFPSKGFPFFFFKSLEFGKLFVCCSSVFFISLPFSWMDFLSSSIPTALLLSSSSNRKSF